MRGGGSSAASKPSGSREGAGGCPWGVWGVQAVLDKAGNRVSIGCAGVLRAVPKSPYPLAFPSCSPRAELALGWILLLLGTI